MRKGFLKSDALELSLDSDLTNAAVARREVGAYAFAAGFDEEAVQAARTVVTEAFTNAASHAYEEGEGPIEIEARADGPALTVVVRDYGDGIKPSPIASQGHGRLGLLMIAALAELCQIRRLRPRGTELLAVITRSGEPSAPTGLRTSRSEPRTLVA
ncbi:ATP-binding protein [Thermoleophilia bacterium SCSIO 60948]|nr:ATP-binding protein [Thermoleophilia bacterium SCSIO 60948]